MADWLSLISPLIGLMVLMCRCLPTGIVQLIAILTKDAQRRLICMEILRLRHKDAAALSCYLSVESEQRATRTYLRPTERPEASHADLSSSCSP